MTAGTELRRPRSPWASDLRALSSGNAGAVLERNLRSARSTTWLIVLTGFFEPVFYLLAMGVGLGRYIGDVTTSSGGTVSYAAFIAPALLAVSAMNGAVYDSTWNVFFKMHFGKLYDAMLATSLGPLDVAFGEISYALLRGVLYAGGFLAVMAAMVEGVSKGRTRRGGEFIRADFSDSSGQFSAACFEESLVDSFQRWAEEGTCVLLNVELDAPSPEEPPRITVRGARPLAEVHNNARMLLTLDVHTAEALQELRLALSESEEGRGEVLARLRISEGPDPLVRLGRDFELDGELAERLAHIAGLANVSLTARRTQPSLRLVA